VVHICYYKIVFIYDLTPCLCLKALWAPLATRDGAVTRLRGASTGSGDGFISFDVII